MTRQRRNPGTDARATSTTPIAEPNPTAPTPATGSRQVSWLSVHEFVTAVLDQVNGWPMAGTPAWCSLGDSDPAKWAALLDGAQHWALRVETLQEAHAHAGRAVCGAVDWTKVSREVKQRNDFYASRPWLKRATP